MLIHKHTKQIVILSMWPDRMAIQYWPKLGLSRSGNPALAKYTHKPWEAGTVPFSTISLFCWQYAFLEDMDDFNNTHPSAWISPVPSWRQNLERVEVGPCLAGAVEAEPEAQRWKRIVSCEVSRWNPKLWRNMPTDFLGMSSPSVAPMSCGWSSIDECN